MKYLLPVLVLLLLALDAQAGLQLSRMFGDHMVMQQDVKVPVWGQAAPGAEVTVTLDQQSKTATADSTGKWSVQLDPMKTGDPRSMRVSDGKDTLTVKDILVGEVWFCSGQSNMWWSVSAAGNGKEETAAANHPQLRLFTVPQRVSPEPLDTLEGGEWQVCSPETAGSFSATAYYFGRALQSKLNVPVGLINASWGGTLVYSWTPMDTLKANPDFAGAITTFDSAVKRFHELRAKGLFDEDGNYVDPGIQSNEKGWEKSELDDAAWKEMPLPLEFDSPKGKLYVDGAVWFRKEVEIPATWRGNLEVRLGRIKQYDITWFNGTEIGRTDAAKRKANPKTWRRRSYTVPANLVKPGKNVIAVRVFNIKGFGGILGFQGWGNPNFAVRPANAKGGYGNGIDLSGPWKYKVGVNYKQLPLYGITTDHRLPSGLFNAMVKPVIPFAIQGAIWYQGESDGPIFNNQTEAFEYRKRFSAMIQSWRTAWSLGDFPFVFVQLPNYGPIKNEPEDGNLPSNAWPILRESQSVALTLPNTSMVTAIDLGDEKNIHPPNKQEVGARLAANALTLAYGSPEEPMGPVFRGLQVEEGKIRILFDHTAGKLEARGPVLKGFAIAGEDKKFVWADAAIDGDSVVASSALVPKPVAVRYAWANNPAGCNLVNKNDLPAAPFRTDSWQRTVPLTK